ncbi:MAG: hypothetical protein JJ931_01290 [Henriciella sp.]|nr:hypothetical protein [Henriciella sp.]MBO6694034.1 hypothetical protein [Henriciella sp.]
MSHQAGFDFSTKLKNDETLLWTGHGSGRNLSFNILFPIVGVSLLGLFLILAYPLSGFQMEMGLVSLWALVISGIVLWFFRARMLGPSKEEYAISNQRIFIVSGPIGRICRTYLPAPKKRARGVEMKFYAIKHVRKRSTVIFLPARSKSMPQGYPPAFVGVENSLEVAELAAETFDLKLIKR